MTFDVTRNAKHYATVIKSFRDKDTETLYAGKLVRRFETCLRQAIKRLDRLDAAISLNDLRALRGNRLEALVGDRAGQYSIRINDQWRVCFRWRSEGAEEVEIVDYHLGEQGMTIERGQPPIHPGEQLLDELEELDMSARALAMALDIPVNRITQILKAQRGITADTALRLARYFGTSAEFWLNLQKIFELRTAERDAGQTISARVRPRAA